MKLKVLYQKLSQEKKFNDIENPVFVKYNFNVKKNKRIKW